MASKDVPPAPPPPPAPKPAAPSAPVAKPPTVAEPGPAGAYLVELLIYNGAPFKDHWGFWIGSHTNPSIGMLVHATGDVKNGFKYEIKRGYDISQTSRSLRRIKLQWVDKQYFNETTIYNSGQLKTDDVPASGFETSAHKVKAPEKTLNAIDEMPSSSGKVIRQRNCQTWVIEASDQLVNDHILSKEIADYLHAIEQ